MKGSLERQDYLETVLKWISDGDGKGYMAKHHLDANALELKTYFEDVINWVKTVFPKYRGTMADVPWGVLYNTYKGRAYDPTTLEAEVSKLLKDPDAGSHAGVYRYVLAAPGTERRIAEKWLSIRVFDETTKESAYESQNGLCPAKSCAGGGRKFELSEMEADHITPWHLGGRTILDNCRMLCKACNRRKGGV